MQKTKDLTKEVLLLKNKELSESDRREIFSNIMKRYDRQILAWCIKLTFSFEDAEDIRNESMFRIFNKIDTYDHEKGSFGAWSYSIVKNVAYDYNSKKYRYQTREEEYFKGTLDDKLKYPRPIDHNIIVTELDSEIQKILEPLEVAVYKGKTLKKNEKEIFDDIKALGELEEVPKNINRYIQNIFKRVKRKILKFINSNPKYSLSDDFIRSKLRVYRDLMRMTNISAFDSLIIWKKKSITSPEEKKDVLIILFCGIYGFDPEEEEFNVDNLRKLSDICNELGIDRNDLESVKAVFSEEIVKNL